MKWKEHKPDTLIVVATVGAFLAVVADQLVEHPFNVALAFGIGIVVGGVAAYMAVTP